MRGSATAAGIALRPTLRYLLRAPDAIFGHDFREHEQVQAMGIREVLSTLRSLW